jgi:tripartite-type tricarboxylate transporter receptor subunit TctC
MLRLVPAASKPSTIVLATALTLIGSGLAHAQEDYPNRTIKIVVPLPPGGSADLVPRMLADKLMAKWSQPVIIENKPGAGGVLGTDMVSKSPPDGYTLVAPPQAPLVISQHFHANLAYDPDALTPITVMSTQPYVLIANPNAPFKTLAEMVAYAKANPGKISFASPGVGSAPHLTMEWLKIAADIPITHVPYRGSAQALTDVIAGHVHVMFDSLGNPLNAIKDGKVRLLAVSSDKRIPEAPDAPTVAESYPGFKSMSWFAVVGPPKLPPVIATKLQSAMAEALKLPDVTKRIQDMSAQPVGSTPAETAALFKEEAERWGKIIRAAGIKAE